MQTRRAALLTIAGAAASPLFSKQVFSQEAGPNAGHLMADETPAVQSYAAVFFKQPDYAVVSRLADLILPRTDTPGAVDAHVPYRIDREVGAYPGLQTRFEQGLQMLQTEARSAGAADFMTLSEAQQTAILKAMSEAPDSPQGQFFETVKGLTVDWYYRSEEGLVKELGFHGNTFRPDFPGCTHPEHWPTASEETK